MPPARGAPRRASPRASAGWRPDQPRSAAHPGDALVEPVADEFFPGGHVPSVLLWAESRSHGRIGLVNGAKRICPTRDFVNTSAVEGRESRCSRPAPAATFFVPATAPSARTIPPGAEVRLPCQRAFPGDPRGQAALAGTSTWTAATPWAETGMTDGLTRRDSTPPSVANRNACTSAEGIGLASRNPCTSAQPSSRRT